jgi:hypothetical protein
MTHKLRRRALLQDKIAVLNTVKLVCECAGQVQVLLEKGVLRTPFEVGKEAHGGETGECSVLL